MVALDEIDIINIYRLFNSSICKIDCGERCAVYNEGRTPFCCDIRHAVPTAYKAEWEYLRASTDLWHPWQGEDEAETARLTLETPPGLVLIECQGQRFCRREFRSVTCRAFPFFPYLDSLGHILGLAYYWEYRDRCWVISHLEEVTQAYITEFFETYEMLFMRIPEEQDNFSAHSAEMRRIYARSRRRIHILGRDGKAYAISPRREVIEEIAFGELPRFGIYKIIATLPFPDE